MDFTETPFVNSIKIGFFATPRKVFVKKTNALVIMCTQYLIETLTINETKFGFFIPPRRVFVKKTKLPFTETPFVNGLKTGCVLN